VGPGEIQWDKKNSMNEADELKPASKEQSRLYLLCESLDVR
jgi:hypothetical protein